MELSSKTVEKPEHCVGFVKRDFKIIWQKVLIFTILHFKALYGFYLMFTSANWKTSLFAFTLERVSKLGNTAGVHRLWSHRAYKARWPLRIFLCILNTIEFEGDIYGWCKDHRIHHKFAETDADPHNIKRGFFFAHIGWILCSRHPKNIEKEKTISLDDVFSDPIVRFQRRFYFPLVLFFSFYLPTMIPVWCWGETAWNSFFIVGMARYCISLHLTWLENSLAHTYGYRPFDKHIGARNNPVMALFTAGEGWHNYHHVFPWDYANGEKGFTFNLTKIFIDVMAMIGLAYDIKSTNPKLIKARMLRAGDGTGITFSENLKDY